MTASEGVTAAEETSAHLPPAHQEAVRAATTWALRSRQLAEVRDARHAVQAQWAADVATLHCLLWESGLAGVADPAAHLDTVSGVVQKAFRQAGETTEGLHEEPGAIVTRARTVLARAFGGSVERLLADRFTDLDHLEALGAVAAGPTRSDRGPDALMAELRTVALDCSTVARAMTAAGLAADASDQARQAVLATFEAALVSKATSAGEAWSAAVDLRWELAVARLHEGPWNEVEPELLAAELVAAMPPEDRDDLHAQFGALL